MKFQLKREMRFWPNHKCDLYAISETGFKTGLRPYCLPTTLLETWPPVNLTPNYAKCCQVAVPCNCQMMGQINPAGFQSPMCMFYVYVTVEIKYCWVWLWNIRKKTCSQCLLPGANGTPTCNSSVSCQESTESQGSHVEVPWKPQEGL